MENIEKVYYDNDNNVEVHCFKQFTDYHFLNRGENYQFKTYRIGRLNYFTISDLLKYWGKYNLPLGDLDIINKVSINILYHDLDNALRRLPSCVVDEKDIEKICVDIYSSLMGLKQCDEERVNLIADAYFSNIDYANFSKDIDIQKRDELFEKLDNKYLFQQDEDHFVKISLSDKQPFQTGKKIDIIVDSNKNLKQENIYNRKLLQKEIDFIKSLRQSDGEK